MENRNENGNSEFPLKPILVGGFILLVWKTVEVITTLITVFFSALMTIGIVAVSLFAAYMVFSFIRDREFGENKKTRKTNRLERELARTLANTPKHLREEVKEYFQKKQREVFTEKPTSRLDDVLDRTKQVVSTFRGGRNGNKDSHR